MEAIGHSDCNNRKRRPMEPPLNKWLRGRDLNPGPQGYESCELSDCSTPRFYVLLVVPCALGGDKLGIFYERKTATPIDHCRYYYRNLQWRNCVDRKKKPATRLGIARWFCRLWRSPGSCGVARSERRDLPRC